MLPLIELSQLVNLTVLTGVFHAFKTLQSSRLRFEKDLNLLDVAKECGLVQFLTQTTVFS